MGAFSLGYGAGTIFYNALSFKTQMYLEDVADQWEWNDLWNCPFGLCYL